MNYTDAELNGFAAVAWAADAELRAQQGDPAPSLPGDHGDADAHEVTLARVRAVLGGATPGELHEAFVRTREAQGWTFGRADTRAKTDPALVPYAQLPEAQRVRDRMFAAILLEVPGLAAAARDAERERIRQLAIDCRAVSVSPTGRMLPFEEMLRHSPEENAAALLEVAVAGTDGAQVSPDLSCPRCAPDGVAGTEDAGTLSEDPDYDPWDNSGRPATQDIL